MTTAVAHTALRLALRSMLADVTYPEAMTSRPWVEARLGEAAWSNTLTAQLTALALRWATTQGASTAQTIRTALGEERSEETTTETPSYQARQERVRTALYNSYGRTETMSIPDGTENTREEVDTALTPLFAQTLDDVAETMKEDPYWFPEDQKRYDAAMQLVREGKVTCDRFGIYHVTGSKGAIYDCDKACPCYDGQHGKSKWCRHLIATAAYRKVMARLSALETEPMLFPQTPTVDQRLATPAKEPAMPTATADRSIPDMTGKAPHVPQETSSPADVHRDAPNPERASMAAVRLAGGLALPKRSISAIIADLSRPLPDACVATLPASPKRPSQSYLHWHTVAAVLDTYAPGWQGAVVRVEKVGEKCAVTYRITIPALEGDCSREDAGMEDEDKDDYGDAMTNAIATAFKRTAAKFGVGRWLYGRDETAAALVSHLRKEKTQALSDLSACVTTQGLDKDAVITWLQRHTGSQKNTEIPLWAIRALLSHLSTPGGDTEEARTARHHPAI